ncbi:hypothetical protein LAWI1_G005248 [Lachnellula willkommii]|uniref:Uncharacterized protein n=1 Tax=Lachnellula willkommii TaxID=215461 RepID=A0A559MB92_9HELO|nr:hypothetical protein LAWI1_G005248 [Lachnellula willkommii]
MFRHSSISNLTLWEKEQVARIVSLSDSQVMQELHAIMRGQDYSWSNISRRLQDQMNAGYLELDHFNPGNILYEWNVLCDEKITWQLHGCPSFKSFKFNRACLINLKIIPTQAGLGIKGRKFVTCNLDSNTLYANLAVNGIEDIDNAEFRAGSIENPRYYYAEGPEFRIEYIHDRVEY